MPSRARVAFIRLTHRLARMAVQNCRTPLRGLLRGTAGAMDQVRYARDIGLEPRSAVGSRAGYSAAHFCILGDFTMDAAAAAAAGEWITAAGVFDGVVNLAAKSLIATDISAAI